MTTTGERSATLDRASALLKYRALCARSTNGCDAGYAATHGSNGGELPGTATMRVSVREGWNIAKSAHGPWRLSRTPALAARCFSQLGLPSLAAR